MATSSPNLKVEPVAPVEATPLPAKPKSRRRPLIVGGVVLGLLVAFGVWRLINAGNETTDDAQVEAELVPVSVRVPGPVLRVAVKDNTHVKKGDVLVELDPVEYEVKLRQAQAELATAKANLAAAEAQATVATAGARSGLSGARAQVAVSGAGISTAKAAVTRAEAEARRTRLDLERAKKLRAEDAVSQASLDNAQAMADAAAAALEQARAQLASSEEGRRAAESHLTESGTVDSKIAAAEAGVALARARVDAATAAVDQAKLALSYTKIVAPADGEISRLNLREGQLVGAGQPVAQLVPETTYVIANFKETQIGQMREGQDVEVEIDAVPGKTLHGKIESLAGATGARFSLLPADNASGNFVKVVQRVPVRIAWTELPKDLHLRAGLSADVTVHTSK